MKALNEHQTIPEYTHILPEWYYVKYVLNFFTTVGNFDATNQQHSMKDDNYYLYTCLQLIEEKLQWGESQYWLNSHFERLSTLVSTNSGIYISKNTLKRLFGKDKSYRTGYRPQEATKNALALFLGYHDWDTFINMSKKNEGTEVTKLNPSSANVSSTKSDNTNLMEVLLAKYKLKWIKLAGLLILLSGVTLVLRNNILEKKEVSKKLFIHFDGKNLAGTVPLMAGFEYDVTQGPYQNYWINFGPWSEPIIKDNHTHTFRFDLPGSYEAQLMGDDHKLAAVNVVAYSKGWTPILIQNNQFQVLSTKLLETNTGRLFYPPKLLRQVDTTREYWLSYRNVKDFGISGDDCTLECKLLSSFPRLRKDSSCFDLYDARIDIIGEHGAGYVLFVDPQCLEYARIGFGEKAFNGLYDPLEILGCDFSQWQKVRVETKAGIVKLYYEDKLIYQFRYTNRIGQIKGLYFTFKWGGGVDDVKLYNADYQHIYIDSFTDSNSKP